jgi:hypothetical protein
MKHRSLPLGVLCIANPSNLVFLTRLFGEQEATEKTEQDGSTAVTRLRSLCITNPQNFVFLTRFFREQETTEKTEQDGSTAVTRLRSLCFLLFQVWLRPKAALICSVAESRE